MITQQPILQSRFRTGSLPIHTTPCKLADYCKSYYSGNGGGLNTANFVNGRNNITLTNLKLDHKGRNDETMSAEQPGHQLHKPLPGTSTSMSTPTSILIANHAPKLVIEYRNQSKINNTGSTNISGYLLMQVQYYN